MKVAFLEPLQGVAADLAPKFFAPDEMLVAPAAGELPDGWREAGAIVWSSYPLDHTVIDEMPNLMLAQRLGRFRAQGDASAAFERGVAVSVLPHGTAGRVAEHTFTLILGLFRGLLRSHEAVVEGHNPADMTPEERVGSTPTVNWARVPDLRSLYFKTVGIAGFGEIGACLALLLAPFGCRVLYNKRTPLTPEQERFFGVAPASLDDLLRASDVVVNLIPVSDATRGMLGAREFGLMQTSAFFVNTGRAATTDEAALIAALTEGRIAGAGIDVFSLEPLPPDHPMARAPNVLLSPHTAGGTPQGAVNGLAGCTDTFERIRENMRRVETGEPVLGGVSGL